MKLSHAVETEFIANMADPLWRLSNLYKIIAKDSSVITFKPNPVQAQFFAEMHTRNVIPKARQRGLSTAIQMLMLDTALFTDNFKGKVIAQDKEAAAEIFRDKLKFAYDNLPPLLREQFPLQRDSATELLFANGSSVAVSTSARSGTVQMLHVSEFGKIAAKYPQKAKEVLTGSIPAVPIDGLVFVESTAEGQEGEFYSMVQSAKALQESNKRLNPLDFKLHFYSWWDAEEYQLHDDQVIITDTDNLYFDKLESELGIVIPIPRRAWYVETRKHMGSQENMWQEYPSTVDEAFKVSTEGTYYAQQFSDARKANRISNVPYDPSIPVNTFWDIGANDETAIWMIQSTRFSHNVIDYIEASGEAFKFFVDAMSERGYTWGAHYLPHDATHKRQLGIVNKSAEEMLKELAPGWRFEIVPRIPDVITGIQQVRNALALCYFDQTKCQTGLKRLEMYRKEWDTRMAVWKSNPRHDQASNGADAFRGFAQALTNKQIGSLRMPKSEEHVSWRERLNKRVKTEKSRLCM